MKRPIIFWGARGHALVLHDFIGTLGYELACTIDNNPDVPAPFPEVPLLRGEVPLREWMKGRTGVYCLTAIGGARGKERCDLLNLMQSAGAIPAIVVHPHATVASSAHLGPGSQVLAGAIVSAACQLGTASIVNHRAIVDHECVLGKSVHVAPGATLTGCVEVGDYSFVGAGAVILPRLKIGANVIIGAGAVVTKDLPDNVIAYGHPARVMGPNV